MAATVRSFIRLRHTVLCLAAATGLLALPASQAQVLSAGIAHSCAIDAGGGVQCWGANGSGQLGDGSFSSRTVPARVKRLNAGIVAVAASAAERSCAVRATGEVLCWGSTDPTGANLTPPQPTPAAIDGLTGVVAIALGSGHACALQSNGALLCWGVNGRGQLGLGMTGGRVDLPAQVSGFGPGSGVVAIAAGRTHTCAVKSDQSVYCWGDNQLGALGDGTTTDRSMPTLVATLGAGSGTTQISAGDGYSCAARNNGAAMCWGTNGAGQLGNGSRTASLVPVYALGLGSAAVGTGVYLSHACARTSGGAMFCWGGNSNGQLGDGTLTDRLIPVTPLTLGVGEGAGVDAIAVGGGHSCARKNTGAVVCWGQNQTGQLGNGTRDSAVAPQPVAFGDSIFRDGLE